MVVLIIKHSAPILFGVDADRINQMMVAGLAAINAALVLKRGQVTPIYHAKPSTDTIILDPALTAAEIKIIQGYDANGNPPVTEPIYGNGSSIKHEPFNYVIIVFDEALLANVQTNRAAIIAAIKAL